MLKRILSVLILGAFVAFSNSAFAASLTLTKIGALDTGGNTYPQWWYTASSPVFAGTADAGATVNVTINGSSDAVTADSSGNWTYASSLGEGDHNIMFESGGVSYSFLLSITPTLPESFTSNTTTETSQSTVPVPDTGMNHIAGFVVAVSAIALGTYFYDRKNTNKEFENRILKDL